MVLSGRIQAIDTLRAITMFLMVFVNDVAGVDKIPKWIGHTAADVDGMGFSDLIFPAFLFIVGLSLPFAIQNRINKGDGFIALAKYILFRSAALIIMGFFHVNLENYNSELAILPQSVFTILITIGFFLVWLDEPKPKFKLSKKLRYLLAAIGIIIIITMASLYVGGTTAQPHGLQPHWWGILGLIGWAYFFSAFTYLITQAKLFWLLLAFTIYAAINVTTHMDLLHVNLWQIGDASSITLMMGGTVISSFYQLRLGKQQSVILLLLLTIAGICCIVFGFVVRPFAGGISKIYATPAWVFICMGITILMFQLTVYLTDVMRKQHWLALLRPAGTSTLTCYLMPYIIYAIMALTHFSYPNFLNYGIGGIFRSLLFAFVVVQLVAFMEKYNLRLKI